MSVCQLPLQRRDSVPDNVLKGKDVPAQALRPPAAAPQRSNKQADKSPSTPIENNSFFANTNNTNASITGAADRYLCDSNDDDDEDAFTGVGVSADQDACLLFMCQVVNELVGAALSLRTVTFRGSQEKSVPSAATPAAQTSPPSITLARDGQQLKRELARMDLFTLRVVLLLLTQNESWWMCEYFTPSTLGTPDSPACFRCRPDLTPIHHVVPSTLSQLEECVTSVLFRDADYAQAGARRLASNLAVELFSLMCKVERTPRGRRGAPDDEVRPRAVSSH